MSWVPNKNKTYKAPVQAPPTPNIKPPPAPPAAPMMQPHPMQQVQPQQPVQMQQTAQVPPQQMQQAVQAPQQQIYAVPHQGTMVYTQPQMAQQPVMVPMNQPMQGAETQSFLMVPEPVTPGTTNSQRLFRTLARSAIKSTALSLANFVDYQPFGMPEAPKE